jgi:hypothetical protein
VRDFHFVVQLRPDRRRLSWAYFCRIMTLALPPGFAVDREV